MFFFEISDLFRAETRCMKSGGSRMEIQYESKKDIFIELEKICGDWNVYGKGIVRARPKLYASKIMNGM
jgi:hypothetical protein